MRVMYKTGVDTEMYLEVHVFTPPGSATVYKRKVKKKFKSY